VEAVTEWKEETGRKEQRERKTDSITTRFKVYGALSGKGCRLRSLYEVVARCG
jgi:hypothetical protein